MVFSKSTVVTPSQADTHPVLLTPAAEPTHIPGNAGRQQEEYILLSLSGAVYALGEEEQSTVESRCGVDLSSVTFFTAPGVELAARHFNVFFGVN